VLLSRRRTKRIRTWIAVVAGAAVLCSIPVMLEIRDKVRLIRIMDQQQQIVAASAQKRSALASVVTSLADLNDRINRAEKLRSKRAWSNLVWQISDSMPGEVWLTSMRSLTAPPKSAAETEPAAGGGQASDKAAPVSVVMDGPRGLEFTGFAVSHDDLYDFMTRIKNMKVFASVELNRASKEPVLRSQAVRFELSCMW
jgi:Tfp pilus assembly protein PilN